MVWRPAKGIDHVIGRPVHGRKSAEQLHFALGLLLEQVVLEDLPVQIEQAHLEGRALQVGDGAVHPLVLGDGLFYQPQFF